MCSLNTVRLIGTICPLALQVIDLGGESISSHEYSHLARVTEFKYSAKLGTVFRRWHGEKLCYTRYAAVRQPGNEQFLHTI